MFSPNPSNERANTSRTLSGHAGVTQWTSPLDYNRLVTGGRG